MKWRKLGLVFCPDGSLDWASSHAMLPTPLQLPDGKIRLFVACADASVVSRVTYIDIDPSAPTTIVHTPERPVLDIGEAGAFDDNGVNPCSIVEHEGQLRLYYVGYQLQQKVPYTLFTGVAQSADSAGPFQRLRRTPILDRTDEEMFFRTAPCVMHHEGGWRMWYIGGGHWTEVNGKIQPIYSVRHIASLDGISWTEASTLCFAPNLPDEIGFGRPFVRRIENAFEMYFSIRGRSGYRAGYATSADGLVWSRHADLKVLEPSAEGWDSQMVCYGAVVDAPQGQLMYYNGNGFGRTGVGVCIRES